MTLAVEAGLFHAEPVFGHAVFRAVTRVDIRVTTGMEIMLCRA